MQWRDTEYTVEQVREALEASIAKWDKNTRVRVIGSAKIGSRDCPLCHLFHESETKGLHICLECPVGAFYCQGSPYEQVAEIYDEWDIGCATAADFREASKAERDFLISLRETVK